MIDADSTTSERGILWMAATPIGNLGDVTQRLKETFAACDYVAAEDSRRTRRLLSALDVRKPVMALTSEREKQRGEIVLKDLLAGRKVVLTCDSGVPGVADPGAWLAARAWENGVRVVPIPGPSAVTALLSASGLPADRFRFDGFAPREEKKKRLWIDALRGRQETTVFFEAPTRIQGVLDLLHREFPGRRAAVGRELTKLYEQIVVGRLGLDRALFDAIPGRGEFAVALGPAVEDEEGKGQDGDLLRELRRFLGVCRDEGLSARQASRLAAVWLKTPKNLAYREAAGFFKDPDSGGDVQ